MYESIKPKFTITEYVRKVSLIHSYKYDYSLVSTSYSHEKISIICHKHGVFEQTVAHHIVSNGCPNCAYDKQRISNEEFKRQSDDIHKGKYDYSLVNLTKGSKEKVKIGCPVHGLFVQTASAHMHGKGCRKCGVASMGLGYRLSTEEFISRAIKVHGQKYNYCNSKYITSEDKVEIICPVHGNFHQRPGCHISGKGCAKCRNDKTTYNMVDRYTTDPELGKRTGSIYLVEMSDGKETFLKVGITCNKPGRLKVYNKQRNIYNYKFIYEKELTNIDSALLERKLIRQLKLLGEKYKPIKKFTGHTECFNMAAKDFITGFIDNHILNKNNEMLELYE